jgi:hypothetical protein
MPKLTWRPTMHLRWLVTVNGCHPSDGLLQQQWECIETYEKMWKNIRIDVVSKADHYLATHDGGTS